MVSQSKSAIIASAAALLMLSACGSADDESSIAGQFNKGFDDTWYEESVKACVAEAVKVGAAETDAQAPCECVMEKLQGDLDGMSEKLNPPEEKMNKALKACDIPV